MNQLTINGVFYKHEQPEPNIFRVYGHDAILHMQELYNEGMRVPVSYGERNWAGVVFIRAIHITLGNSESFADVEIMRVPK